MTWIMLRNAAYARHRWYNLVYEGGCPVRWQWHLQMLRSFYGW